MDPIGLAGIAGVLLVKEAGLPVPVPGDLIVLSAGIAAANGDLDPVVALPAIVAATIIGGVIQYGARLGGRGVSSLPRACHRRRRLGLTRAFVARPQECVVA